jgi:DNA-binding NarL/FixJ family response regulator
VEVARGVSCPVFVGRAEERARLRRAVTAVGPDRARLVLVAGEAGVGKTRLVADAVEWARGRAMTVLEGACLPLGETLAFGPFVEMLGAEVFLGAEAGDRLRLFRAVADGLAGRAGTAPHLVVVEDLHWADASTCDLVVFCARVLGAERLVLVGTYRREEVPPSGPLGRLLGELGAAPWMERIDLTAFTRDETAELVAAVRGDDAAEELADRVHIRSGGNPFFAEELLAMGASVDQLPHTVRGTVLARLGRLGPAARTVAGVVAVAGPRVHPELVLAASGLEPRAVDGAVARLVANGLVVVEDNGLGFRHALAQEAVAGDLGPGERTALHRRVAELLSVRHELACSPAPGSAAAERAHHWEAAGAPTRALAEATRAVAETNTRVAPAEALAHLERVLRLCERVPDHTRIVGADRASLVQRAGEAAIAAGRYERASELLQAARQELGEGAEPHRLALVVAALSVAERMRGRLEEANTLIDEAARIIPADPPTPELAFVLARQAYDWIGTRHQVRGLVPLARRAVAVAASVDQPAEEAVALMALGWGLVYTTGEDDEEGLAAYRRALELARRHADLRTWALIVFNNAHLHRSLDHLDDALAVALDACRELARFGAPPEHLSIVAASAAGTLIALGRLDDAERLLAGVDPSPGLGDWHRRCRLIEVQLLRGRLRQARALYEGWIHDLEARPLRAQTAVVGVPLAAAEGRWEDARTLALHGLRASVTDWAALPFPGYDLAVLIGAQGLRAEADRREAGAGDAGAPRAVEELVDGLHALHHEQRRVYGRPRGADTACTTAMAEAEAARARGQDDPDRWRAVVAAADASVQPWPRAYARLRLSCALLANGGRRAEATELLRAAHSLAATMDASVLVGDIEAAARRFRIALAAEAATDPLARFGLTTREREFLALVAAGRSNREIADALYISVKTASVHVTNILRKLGVTNRVQAAAIAHRSGASAP